MRKEDIKTIIFAAIICVVCSLILSFTASALKENIETNQEIDVKKNVLKAFGIEMTIKEDGKKRSITSEEVEQYFIDHISEYVIDREAGTIDDSLTAQDLIDNPQLDTNGIPVKLPLYKWKDDGKVTRYAFPQKGRGLWSTVYSYMALNKEIDSIIGVTFYGHKETPGLGGECSQDWFQNQFTNKVIWTEGEYKSFEVVKGGVKNKYPNGNDHAVDGIAGATITSRGIESFINQYIDLYSKYFDKVRAL